MLGTYGTPRYDAIRHGDISVLTCLLDLIEILTDTPPSLHAHDADDIVESRLAARRQDPVDHRCPTLYYSNSLVLFSSCFPTLYTQPYLFRTRRATTTITPPRLPVLVFGRRTMIRCPVSV